MTRMQNPPQPPQPGPVDETELRRRALIEALKQGLGVAEGAATSPPFQPVPLSMPAGAQGPTMTPGRMMPSPPLPQSQYTQAPTAGQAPMMYNPQSRPPPQKYG